MSVTPRALSPASETSDDFASTTVVDSEDGDDHGNGIGNGDEDEAEDGSRIILSPDEVITAWEHAGIDESTQHACVDILVARAIRRDSSIKSSVHSSLLPDPTSLTPDLVLNLLCTRIRTVTADNEAFEQIPLPCWPHHARCFE
jgi:hypothetical protein